MKCIAANIDIIIIEGGTFDKTYQWKTGDPAVAVDLTGYSANMQIRAKTKSETILLEVPLLAIISETYYTYYYSNKAPVNSLLTPKDYMNYCNVKFKYLSDWINENPGVKITDFGTRRRISFQNHNGIISMLKERIPKNFIGTSNVYFAKMHNLVPIGTMAHEWIQAHQQLNWKIADSQKAAFDMWSKEYRGDLGIALTDCIGVDSFIKDFDLFFSKLFDGVRHDSGDPYIWTDKMIKHYNSLKIDPKTKLFVYSDGLNFVRMQELYKRYGEEEKLNLMFGIGTYLTNDVPGVSPLNIVIKMTEMNNRPVVKISDSPGKTICKDQQYINYVKSVFGL